MSNTNKELYQEAWNEYHKGSEIDLLLTQLRRHLKQQELIRNAEIAPYGMSCFISIDNVYIPLLIEALEKLK